MSSVIDPSIPLSGTGGFDVTKIANLADLAQTMKMRQVQMQNQNALSGLLANPNSYDQSGNVTPNALRGIMAASPQVGLSIRDQNLQEQLRKAQEQHYQTEAGKASFDASARIAGASYDVYTEAKAKGASEEAAREAATKARNEAVMNSGGVIPENFAKSILGSAWEPENAKTFAGMSTEWVQNRRQQETVKQDQKRLDLAQHAQETKDRHELEVEKQDAARDRIMIEAISKKDEDPKREAVAQFKKENPNATSQQLAQFIQGLGAAPRSAPAMALRKYLDEHPEATAEDVEKFNADLKATSSATTAFATGKQGQALNSFNVATAHLQLLDQLGSALNNKDSRTVDKIKNAWAKEFGGEAPTDFQAAKKIVSDEVVKSIVAGGGGVADRDAAQAAFDQANSPKQLKGAISTVYRLMGGQLKGLQRQYEQTTKKTDFLDRLSPEAKDALLGHDDKKKDDSKKSDHPDDIQAILDKYSK